jgi:hypothetical protein
VLGAIILSLVAYLVPKDIETLRSQMRERAALERQQAIAA